MNIKVFGSSLNTTSNSFHDGIFEVTPPPSKSHSIRFLILASLAKGHSRLDNVLISDDIVSTYECFKAFGVQFKYENSDGTRETVFVTPPKEGIFKYAMNMKEVHLNVGNSGTLLYMLSMLSASIPATFHISGDSSIKKRPLQPILEALTELQVSFNLANLDERDYDEKNNSYKIITIYGRKINTNLNIHLNGKFSQVVSGLLIASSFFYAKTNIFLESAGEAPYIMMTLQHLKKRGILVNTNKNLTYYECFGLESFKNQTKIAFQIEDSVLSTAHNEHFFEKTFYCMQGFSASVPNDWSQACFLALASITCNSRIKIVPISMETEQADSSLVGYLKMMNCPICFENNTLKIGIVNELKAANFNLSDTPDSLPYLAALCSIAKGRSILDGIEICKFKECDRVHAIAMELRKLGVNIIEEKNQLIIDGTPQLKARVKLSSHGDHRIAMALIALCLNLKEDEWCIIEGVECCKISYPAFIQTLCHLGANIIEEL